jgi:short-subunit dehydrogenase
MANDLKKIIIIGATSGIGRRLAEIYAAANHHVGITGRREYLLNETREKFPAQIETACFDITMDENKKQLDSLIRRLGGLDLLIISAGSGDITSELHWETDKKTVDTNVNGFVEIANYIFNYFVQQGYGHLAAISSVAANRGNNYAPAYSASKAFQSIYLEGLYIKAKMLKQKIFVTCIEPGFVDTRMAKSDRIFWITPVDKAARQIIKAIQRKKRKVYVSRRWRLVAFFLKWAPGWLYFRLMK